MEEPIERFLRNRLMRRVALEVGDGRSIFGTLTDVTFGERITFWLTPDKDTDRTHSDVMVSIGGNDTFILRISRNNI